jgi:hypothetical protein
MITFPDLQMSLKCPYLGCEGSRHYYIVFGCLEQHIYEIGLCQHHGTVWAADQARGEITCFRTGCYLPVDSYEYDVFNEN